MVLTCATDSGYYHDATCHDVNTTPAMDANQGGHGCPRAYGDAPWACPPFGAELAHYSSKATSVIHWHAKIPFIQYLHYYPQSRPQRRT